METIKLLKPEEVEDVQVIDTADENMAQVIQDAHDLVVGLLEAAGFKAYEFAHPAGDYEVGYYVRNGKVIMVDNHEPNVHNVEVLGTDDTAWILGNVKKTFGEKELTG